MNLVNSIEKQLWTSIHSKGILHHDVRDSYEKAGSTYERIFTSDLTQEELQDVEFSLWKLHYKHIDEFRKGVKPSSVDSSGRRISDSHVEAFKSFLSRATEFYKNLISKARRHFGVSEGEESFPPFHEPKVLKCRFLCHRFCICLGDLARYREQYLKTGDRPNWSAAAAHYLEAAVTWPDSGNPHNQLAVLATYVGDEFLALYHCIRSLAVKEPFPGAWNNLLLLFEKNRSSHLQSLSADVSFNFLNPSERSGFTSCSPSQDREIITGTKLWPLVVRTTSFFFLKSGLDEFPCAFASTMRELDALLGADDEDLKGMSESYLLMDSAREGPFRFLQLVSVFVFVFHNLTPEHETDGSHDKKDEVARLTRLGLITTFVIMGRIIERCLRRYPFESCPLLPAILEFLEYLPPVLDKAEECGFDDESEAAMSYFFGSLVDLLNQLKKQGEYPSPELVALWEDHELRAFAPLASVHARLDFSSHRDLREGFDRGNKLRLHRIKKSGFEIASRQTGSRKWISWDEQEACFFMASNLNTDRKASNGESVAEKDGDNEKYVTTRTEVVVPAEEEEVILLKPLARCQSAPLYSSSGNTREDLEGNQTSTSDDNLRRTASDFSFGEDSTETESSPSFPEGGISGRPPSLSAWVVDSEKENGRFGTGKHNGLSPIDETAPVTSFDDLSISKTEQHSFTSSSSSYSPPTPSAPLLPEDASWFQESTINKGENAYIPNGNREPGLLGYGLPLPGFMKPYTNPPFVGISSSEWLRRYRQSQNLGQGNYHNDLRNFLVHESTKFSLFDRYGTPSDHPMVRSENSLSYPGLDNQFHMQPDYESRGERLIQGYQRTEGFGFGIIPGELSDDPRPFLQYLKDKEWLTEHNQRLRGHSPAYMNN
ncbi:PREDICTED: protein SMG7L isoform X2 [Tarenaya hassleriana]|uniref:protein SMG7L isoform X2 n=1 Tax=Tarenaya hassleriana TaxID=28532 RepID=UPI00053C07F7|nr:PREDICTED: protein SMG7L isoform X2 [Tarenaya hassleriana]XP_010549326.1 PREDICTED: protein SMG7L isoform X2 [Tarenaya hassleriana]XP_010549327.1 PREDICTED: protein SMG7L isoform X2 [Tarenaya hassleriana]XP_010549329.1 PREDICTED: protein SMG7L isoform X2 [Tarenaya hassleriana]